MLVKISEDENHNKIAKPIAGATLGQGVPLGTWCSFEKDVAPSSNWLVAGSSFNANTYPALALYLGTNQVPYRYDHNRPSDYEEMTYNVNTDITLQYDGEILISQLRAANTNFLIYLDGVAVTTLRSTADAFQHITIPFKKGQVLKITDSGLSLFVRYYTHPLFIKATSIASDTDQQAILAQIQAYNTYSTEETLTGKTWFDGKPIYRKVISGLNISLSWNQSYCTDSPQFAPLIDNVESIIKTVLYGKLPSGTTYAQTDDCLPATTMRWTNNTWSFRSFDTRTVSSAIIEYTKTTD